MILEVDFCIVPAAKSSHSAGNKDTVLRCVGGGLERLPTSRDKESVITIRHQSSFSMPMKATETVVTQTTVLSGVRMMLSRLSHSMLRTRKWEI